MKINKFIFGTILIFIVLIFLHSSFVQAVSTSGNNTLSQANESLIQAQKCLNYFYQEGIPYKRANDTYTQALQLYRARVLLNYPNTDFSDIITGAQEVCKLKTSASFAKDELTVFLGYYNQSSAKFNLSSMNQDYSEIISSYHGERFEDVPSLINKGYNDISNIESSQTSLKLFYQSTTRGIKSFFSNNYKGIIFVFVVLLILYFIFRATIKSMIINRKIKRLETERESIYNLIKKSQLEYFKTKTLSETEFSVKIETFKNLIREINREIPELRERLIKLHGFKGLKKVRK
jgi:hypothetical protein